MKTLFASAVLFLILTAGYAHAQTQQTSQFCTGGTCTYVPLEPLPCLAGSTGCKNGALDTSSIASAIPNAFKLLIGAGAIIAVVMIVLGALTYMFSDIAGNKKNALTRIRNAMWAIVILVSSYLILYTINPDLVTFKLNLSVVGNYSTTPNPTGSTPATQLTDAQKQALQNQCAAQSKTVKINPDGTYSCQ